MSKLNLNSHKIKLFLLKNSETKVIKILELCGLQVEKFNIKCLQPYSRAVIYPEYKSSGIQIID